MRRILVLTAVLCLAWSVSTRATITYLKVNGVDSNFAMTQGDTFTWQADCDSGADVWCEIWIDLNGNSQIDEGVDKAWQEGFTQTDGDTTGDGGPEDMDGEVNGEVYLSLPLGLAPGIWMLRFTDMTDTSTVAHAGTVYTIPNPFRVITGQVSGPAGFDSTNVIIEIDQDGKMWSALSGADGVYYLNTDTNFAQGETVRVECEDSEGYVVPSDTEVVLGATDTIYNVDRVYGSPVAYVYGWVKDDLDSILTNENIYLATEPDGGGDHRSGPG